MGRGVARPGVSVVGAGRLCRAVLPLLEDVASYVSSSSPQPPVLRAMLGVMAALDGAQGAHHAEAFAAPALDVALAAEPRGVDEQEALAVHGDGRVDRVTGGPRGRVYDHAIFAE